MSYDAPRVKEAHGNVSLLIYLTYTDGLYWASSGEKCWKTQIQLLTTFNQHKHSCRLFIVLFVL